MAIEYSISYDCVPRQTFGTEGILERMKGEERAQMVIQMFRRNGDQRPPSEMGFEFTRSTPSGDEETRLIVVQDMLDRAAELRDFAHHCEGCPANRTRMPFGCNGFIQYPISAAAETWLLDRLPVPDDIIVWMLLRQGIKEFGYDGTTVQPLRAASDAYFENRQPASRRLGQVNIDANQVFEMIFGVGSIRPNHGALLLLFAHAIPRDIEADAIMSIAPAPADVASRHPFLLNEDAGDDASIAQMKAFFRAMYMAWSLDVPLALDV